MMRNNSENRITMSEIMEHQKVIVLQIIKLDNTITRPLHKLAY